eukprot:Em0016g662a
MISVMMTGVVISVMMTGDFCDAMVVMIAVLNDVMMSVKINAVVKVISARVVMTAALIDVVIAVKVMVISVKVIVIAAIVTGELMNSVRVIAETHIVSMVMLKLTVAKIMHSWILRHALFNGMVATLMVATGTINTLAAKWADLNTAGGSNPVAEHYYDHPFFQTGTMFLGEALCYVAFKAWYIWRQCNNQDMSIFGDQKFNPLIWAIPAMCDLCGTSMMYLGLTWTYAASYQMLRGSVVIFTGLLSVALNLGNKLNTHHWVGMVTVIVGLVVVGVGDYVFYNGGSSVLDKYVVLTGLVFSIAFFNLAGLTVTLTMNATTRMVLDTSSGIIIWVISLAVGWQIFEPLQPVGYIILLAGIWMNDDVIVLRDILPIRELLTSRLDASSCAFWPKSSHYTPELKREDPTRDLTNKVTTHNLTIL